MHQCVRTETFNVCSVVSAVPRSFVQCTRARTGVRKQMSPAGVIVVQTNHLMADRALRIERVKSTPSQQLYELDNPYK